MEFGWLKVFGVGSREERKRLFELVTMVLVTALFVALSRLEGRLFDLSRDLSRHPEFLNSLVYFGLININVVLILVLSFLLFRNIVKLVLDRRRGVIGSKLRSKLVIALVFFAVAPTALLFYISTRFLTDSFETWFSSRVEATMHSTREAGAMVYDRDQRRLSSLARLALQRVEPQRQTLGDFEQPHYDINANKLRGFSREFRVGNVRVYDRDARLIWHNDSDRQPLSAREQRFVMHALQRFQADSSLTTRAIVDADEGHDVVRGVAPIFDPDGIELLGMVVLEERFDTQILQSVETIIEEFGKLKPNAELNRLSYVILLVLMVVIIVFSATWLGFYVARGIIAPIQRLADATREVALGNYSLTLEDRSDDETGQLFRAFNSMIADLKAHENKVLDFTSQLEKTNEELDRRRKYMEVILGNIGAGVFSVDAAGRITSMNRAAERLLNVRADQVLGQMIEEVLDNGLVEALWRPIRERVQYGSFSGEIDLSEIGRDLTLLADGTRIVDENGEDLGIVIVIDDASEQVKVQRVAAWREVARRIAHEIKNPITPIKISAQRLLRRFGDQFKGRDQEVFVTCIETIVSEVDALRDLVNEFSKFSRLPSIKTRPEDVNAIVRDVVGLYSMSYSQIDFDTSGLADHLPLVPLDREQMLRVFTNIIANSIASIPEERDKGAISLRSRLLEGYNTIRVEIVDNGSGIPDHLKQRVLEPYFSTKKEGTGLGLAIVNQIVSDHGGYLRIADNYPIGTVIIIELPYHDGKQKRERIMNDTVRSSEACLALIVDDEDSIRKTLADVFEDEGWQTVTAENGKIGLQLFTRKQPDLVLLDVWMPGMDGIETLQKMRQMNPQTPIVIMSGHGTIETAVRATKLGAFDYLEKPLSLDKIIPLLDHAKQIRLQQDVKSRQSTVPDMIGNSPLISQIKRQINMVSPRNAWILITGENGTGKEVVARHIHEKSSRATKPFVAVNCAAIPEELIESELFGHAKGAFTNAISHKKGKFELAHQGTLFLDEIGDMSLRTQAKILRILQEQAFERVGSTDTILVDVRVIAATNKDLKELIKTGQFREDLYYRLNVVPFHLPPLRERDDDIFDLTQHFLTKMSHELGEKQKTLSLEAQKVMREYPWPGNIRELKNMLERACIMSDAEQIEADFLRDLLGSSEKIGDPLSQEFLAASTLKQAKTDFERAYILGKLEENQWNITKTADAIGLERSNLHRKMKLYGIEPKAKG